MISDHIHATWRLIGKNPDTAWLICQLGGSKLIQYLVALILEIERVSPNG